MSDTCLTRFADQVRTRGEEPAVVTGADPVSFAELDARADRLAGALVANGVRPGDLVGLLLPRSAAFLAALLAVWKAGAAFVPLDPAQPDARLAAILADTGAAVVIADGAAELLAGHRVVDVGTPGDPVGGQRKPTPRDLAYVLYTSGSTGRPKGVMVSHEALTRYVGWLLDVLPITAPVSGLCHTSVGFDFTYSGLLLALTTGGRTVLAPPDARLEDLGELIGAADVDLVRLTPSHVDVVTAVRPAAPRGPRVFLVGGEPLLAKHIRALRAAFPDAAVHNHYGPTEAVIGRSTLPVTELGEQTGEHPVPIGVR
jgi:non-ribosomal peptide synthetase component F